jgi:hypothetical protein
MEKPVVPARLRWNFRRNDSVRALKADVQLIMAFRFRAATAQKCCGLIVIAAEDLVPKRSQRGHRMSEARSGSQSTRLVGRR